jgi:hypothetical protein
LEPFGAEHFAAVLPLLPAEEIKGV